MTSIDHLIGSASRLSAGLLCSNEQKLWESLELYCRTRELADIVPNIQKIIEQNTDFDIGYLLLRPECPFGNNLPGFADTSAFDEYPGNAAFGIKSHDMGLELFAIIADTNLKRARLNLGLILQPDSNSTNDKELLCFHRAVAEENNTPGVAANEEREFMLSRLIHQVRNPLATILISASQMALKSDERFDDDDRMLVDFINSESEKIEYYLSKYSKYALAGKAEMSEVDASGFIRMVKNACSDDQNPANAIIFTISASLANLQLLIDPDQVTVALRELIDNAREATGKKKEKIHVSVRKEDNSVQIIICDNGPGIRPEMLRRVKEPFFSTKDGGSGLGLIIAEKIIITHGGKISIDSQPEKGTRFTVSLPCK
jgi:signal transduction histidine kinase